MVGGLHSMRLMRSLDGMSGWMEEEWWIGLDRLVCNNILAGGFFFFRRMWMVGKLYPGKLQCSRRDRPSVAFACLKIRVITDEFLAMYVT